MCAELRPLTWEPRLNSRAGHAQAALRITPRQTTRFCVLSRVLHTAWNAGFVRTRLGRLPMWPAPALDLDQERSPLGLTLVIGRAGILLAGLGGAMTSKSGDRWSVPCVQSLADGSCVGGAEGDGHDYKELHQVMQRITIIPGGAPDHRDRR